MKKTSGQVTFPFDVSAAYESMRAMKQWGADAIRDCDGTVLPTDLELNVKTYSTYFVTRGDNKWASVNTDESQHFLVMSKKVNAVSDTLTINIMSGYFNEQVEPDFDSDPKKYWEVIDRTTGKVVNPDNWSYCKEDASVTIHSAIKMHEYTVSFFLKTLWDSTQMYNYIVNNWTREKERPFDPRYPKSNRYIKDRLKEWIQNNPKSDVVRFTTFFYHFTLLYNDFKKEKFVDWFGYSASISPKAMDEFEKEYNYRLRAEHIVDEGYYNSQHRVPSKEYKDYIKFVSRFVNAEVKELVDIVHSAKKEAMMFLGDNWIGTEPYGEYFASTGLDCVVGSVGSGTTIRMLSDIQGVKYTEGRFLPYFFPDTFHEGGKPVDELNDIWIKARRAIMRNTIDRIGFGGYYSLAAKFPDFVNRVSDIAQEFRDIYSKVKGIKPHSLFRVGVLNSYGKIRSWQPYMVAHELWYRQTYSYSGICEILSGLPVDVKFINFDDVKQGKLDNIDVIINAGDAGTSFSGGEIWGDAEIISKVKEWVYNGGAFIGIGEPSALQKNGSFFQLSSCLGVEKELGFSLCTNKYNIHPQKNHFILTDAKYGIDYGEGTGNVYALEGATVLDIDLKNDPPRNVNVGNINMAVNDFGKGRGFYLAGCPYSAVNSRLLFRAMCYCLNREDLLERNFSTNIFTEYNYYPQTNLAAIINNSDKPQETTIFDSNGNSQSITLAPLEILWK